MIIPDYMIREYAYIGGIKPFELSNINPASIDLRLGGIIDDFEQTFDIGQSYTIMPGKPILATTLEYIKMPVHWAGVVYLKSSAARLGLDHALAGWVDPGFEGELTLELHAHRPITIVPYQKLIQLVFVQMYAKPKNPYDGRYQKQRGPTRARDDDK